MGGGISFQLVIGVAGTFIILTDVFYYLYLKMANVGPQKKKKKKSKSKKKLQNSLRLEVNILAKESEETTPPPFKPYRNPWFRNLPRIDFRVGVSQEDLWNTALFFPEIFPEQEFSQTRQFMWYMEQAKESLKVAIYTANFRLLEDVLFSLVKKKVQVKVVANFPKLLRLRRRGIQVREKPKLIPSPHVETLFVDHMHNKFIIIDDKAIMTGSLNWTVSAVQENRENVVITNDQDTVDLYVQEFDYLWQISDPAKPKIIAKPPPLTNRQRETAQRTITKFRKSTY